MVPSDGVRKRRMLGHASGGLSLKRTDFDPEDARTSGVEVSRPGPNAGDAGELGEGLVPNIFQLVCKLRPASPDDATFDKHVYPVTSEFV